LTPTKDQLTLVRAFARLTDLAWSADLVGFDVADPGYAARVRYEVAEAEDIEIVLTPSQIIAHYT
jgi:hypothetical protein